MKGWQVTFKYAAASKDADLGWTYGVVEFDSEAERTIRTIGQNLTREEAYAMANAREMVGALGNLWDAIHREDHEDYFDSELVGPELKAAFDVLMRAKGVKA